MSSTTRRQPPNKPTVECIPLASVTFGVTDVISVKPPLSSPTYKTHRPSQSFPFFHRTFVSPRPSRKPPPQYYHFRNTATMRLLATILLTVLAMTSTIRACKCHNPDGSIEWHASHTCCGGGMGVWWTKKADCKTVINGGDHAACCMDFGCTSDCGHV
jgi:hypothetical protein